MNILNNFNVLLLDLNGTFMFGGDRFKPDDDFYPAYRATGGVTLTPGQVREAIDKCYAGMLHLYRTQQGIDDFPTIAEGLAQFANISAPELHVLEKVFSAHEVGIVSADYAALLHRLRRTHRLGLVSNIWSPKDIWLSEFQRAGISDVFECLVFSSDGRSIKPSPVPFQRAMRSFPADSRILFIGDSLEYDIKPAKALGLTTAWINPPGGHSPHADFVLRSLLEIEV